MNEKKIVKFNLYMSFVLLGILIFMLVGATIAYFSEQKQITNTLTSGNVKIALTEAAVKDDGSGNLIEDDSKPRIIGGGDEVVNDYGVVHPGQKIFKDPTIINTGTDPAWIAAKITITDGSGDLTNIMGYEGYEDIDLEILLGGGLLDEHAHFGDWNNLSDVTYNDHFAMVQVPNRAEGKFEFYFFVLDPLESGDSVVIFDELHIPSDWTGSDMQNLKDLKIKVEAFGVQIYELDNCVKAMTEAFPSYFTIN